METTNEFTYIVGEKDDVLLVVFTGKVNTKEVPILEKCDEDIRTKAHKIVIMNFRDVTLFMPAGHVAFVKLQKALRDSKKLLAVVGLRPEIRSALLMSGIVREAELFSNIPEAFKQLTAKKKSA